MAFDLDIEGIGYVAEGGASSGRATAEGRERAVAPTLHCKEIAGIK